MHWTHLKDFLRSKGMTVIRVDLPTVMIEAPSSPAVRGESGNEKQKERNKGWAIVTVAGVNDVEKAMKLKWLVPVVYFFVGSWF